VAPTHEAQHVGKEIKRNEERKKKKFYKVSRIGEGTRDLLVTFIREY
jgi:hypothetical protein